MRQHVDACVPHNNVCETPRWFPDSSHMFVFCLNTDSSTKSVTKQTISLVFFVSMHTFTTCRVLSSPPPPPPPPRGTRFILEEERVGLRVFSAIVGKGHRPDAGAQWCVRCRRKVSKAVTDNRRMTLQLIVRKRTAFGPTGSDQITGQYIENEK